MREIDRHLILYAKHHYKTADIMRDIEKIIAECFLLEEESIGNRDILEVVIQSTLRILKEQDKFDETIVNRIISSSAPHNVLRVTMGGEKYDFYYDFIKTCLSELMILSVYDNKGKKLMYLGKPDENILPLKTRILKGE